MKRIAKAIIAAIGAGGSSAFIIAEQGSAGDTKGWLYAIALAFVTGAITYRVPNAPAS